MSNNVCLRHHSKLCKCHQSRHVLFFRHTLQELDGLVQNCKDAVAAAAATGKHEALKPALATHVGGAWSEARATAAAAERDGQQHAPSNIAVRGSSRAAREQRAHT